MEDTKRPMPMKDGERPEPPKDENGNPIAPPKGMKPPFGMKPPKDGKFPEPPKDEPEKDDPVCGRNRPGISHFAGGYQKGAGME